MSIFRRHRSEHDGEPAPPAQDPAGASRLHATVTGMVQGVGFRYSTLGEADRLGLVGSAGNLPDGRVEVTAEGPLEDVEALLAWLRSEDAPGRVDRVEASIGPASGEFTRFSLF
jgi:acylphosphatase